MSEETKYNGPRMSEQGWFWYKCCKIAVVLILGIVVSVTLYNMHGNHLYITNGYTRQTLQGSSVTQWVKPEEKISENK